jgi:hypothetical protein
MRTVNWHLLFLSVVLVGCSPSSSEDFRQEGEALCRRLTEELQQIHTRDDLLKKAPLLKKRFEQFADLIVQAHIFRKEHLGEAMPEGDGEFFASDALREEMKRIYRIEGARRVIEESQREALFALDASLKKIDSL